MHRTDVAPDRTGLVRPVHSCNGVMVSCDKPHAIVPNNMVIVVVDIVDTRDVESNTCE